METSIYGLPVDENWHLPVDIPTIDELKLARRYAEIAYKVNGTKVPMRLPTNGERATNIEAAKRRQAKLRDSARYRAIRRKP
jgi:hypothetical protein